jgi:antitoxin CcdA
MTMRNMPQTHRRAVNLSLKVQTIDRAKSLELNLSATVDALLAQEVERLYWERWNQDNREAIENYNVRIEHEGLPLARWRNFMQAR